MENTTLIEADSWGKNARVHTYRDAGFAADSCRAPIKRTHRTVRLLISATLMPLILTMASALAQSSPPQPMSNTPLDETLDPVGQGLQGIMIWASDPELRQPKSRYVAFRKHFLLDAPASRAVLHLFADTRYLLWINGQYILRGPARFNPAGPEYDTVDIARFLQPGANLIAVVVLSGVSNGKMMAHAPCLTARLDALESNGADITLQTDPSWKWTDRTRYRTPRVEWGNVRDRIDARVEDGNVTQPGYDDSAWKFAASVDGSRWGPLSARRIPLLRQTPIPTKIEENLSLPAKLTTGQEIHFTLDQLSQAYTSLDLDADAGSEIDLIPQGIQYIARQGRQSYISSDTCAMKDVTIRVKSGRATIHSFAAVEVLYPFDCVGKFLCSDDRLNRIWQMGMRSLELTSEDAYIDCADRERTEWMDDDPPAFDLTRTLMAGPAPNNPATDDPGSYAGPLYADPRLLEELLRRTALTRQPGGWVKAHTCSDRFDIHAYMEDRACDWLEGARRYYESTSQTAVIREIWPCIVSQLDWFLDHRTPRGLVRAREWVVWGNPVGYQTFEGAGLNAFIYRALVDGAFLGSAIGKTSDAARFTEAAGRLSKAFNDVLWDESDGTYYSGYYADYARVLANPKARKLHLAIDNSLVAPTFFPALFALDQGIVPDSRRDSVVRYMLSHRDEAARVMTFYYLDKQLYAADQPDLDQEVIDSTIKRFLPMADTGWHTSWEEFDGGSKAHTYGMFPTYFLSAYVLGVRLDGPVWNKRIVIEPRLASLTFARGTVVTEFGPVAVQWDRKGQTLAFSVDAPPGITERLRFADADPSTLTINGHPARSQRQGRYAFIDLNSQDLRGSISLNPSPQ